MSSHGRRRKGALWDLFCKGANHLPKAPPPNTIWYQGLGFNILIWKGHKHSAYSKHHIFPCTFRFFFCGHAVGTLIYLGSSLLCVAFATPAPPTTPVLTPFPSSHHMLMGIVGRVSLFPRGVHIFPVSSNVQAPTGVNYHQSSCFKVSWFQGEHSKTMMGHICQPGQKAIHMVVIQQPLSLFRLPFRWGQGVQVCWLRSRTADLKISPRLV